MPWAPTDIRLGTRWQHFARQQQPDPINAAAARLTFLGSALTFMRGQGEAFPRTVNELRRILQSRGFKLTRHSHGLVRQQSARDELMYHFRRANGSAGEFMLLEAARDDLPSRITAPGLQPEPTLVWSRDADGELIQDIEYR